MAQENQIWNHLQEQLEQQQRMLHALCNHFKIDQSQWSGGATSGDKPGKAQQSGQRGTQAGNR